MFECHLYKALKSAYPQDEEGNQPPDEGTLDDKSQKILSYGNFLHLHA